MSLTFKGCHSRVLHVLKVQVNNMLVDVPFKRIYECTLPY
jgi:hypothetical protein